MSTPSSSYTHVIKLGSPLGWSPLLWVSCSISQTFSSLYPLPLPLCAHIQIQDAPNPRTFLPSLQLPLQWQFCVFPLAAEEWYLMPLFSSSTHHYPVKRALCGVTNISLLIEEFWNSFIRFNGLTSVQWLPPVSTNGPGALLDLLHSIISHTVFVSILSPTYQILAWSLAHRRGGKGNE